MDLMLIRRWLQYIPDSFVVFPHDLISLDFASQDVYDLELFQCRVTFLNWRAMNSMPFLFEIVLVQHVVVVHRVDRVEIQKDWENQGCRLSSLGFEFFANEALRFVDVNLEGISIY